MKYKVIFITIKGSFMYDYTDDKEIAIKWLENYKYAGMVLDNASGVVVYVKDVIL